MASINYVSRSSWAPLLVQLCLMVAIAMQQQCVHAIRWPFQQKQKYTPLLFFTIPAGKLPEVDAMEKAVRKVEKELGVRVERMDVARHPEKEAVLSGLTNRYNVPVLYNRESMEFYHIPPARKTGNSDDDESKDAPPVHVSMDRIRAWAKGRLVIPPKSASRGRSVGAGAGEGMKVSAPKVITQEDNSIDQDEILEDLTLTPLQRKGKEAMKERTENLAN